MRYWFIHSHARDYPVAGLCRLLQVQRSAYYAWRKRQGTAMSAPDLALRQRMRVLFQASRASMGSRRMMQALRAQGSAVGCERTR